jgi:hypothetical protein
MLNNLFPIKEIKWVIWNTLINNKNKIKCSFYVCEEMKLHSYFLKSFPYAFIVHKKIQFNWHSMERKFFCVLKNNSTNVLFLLWDWMINDI